MAFDDNWVMSSADMQELIDTEGFVQNNPFSPSIELATKLEVIDSLVVDASYLTGIADNQMVKRSLIQKSGAPAPVHTQYQYSGDRTSSLPDGLCGLTGGVWYSAYHDGVGALPVNGDIAYNGINDTTPMSGDGLYRILRDTVGDQQNISVASNGVISIHTCITAPDLTVFTMTIADYSTSALACSSGTVSYFQYYHDGVGELPEYGDTIYDYDNGGYVTVSQGWRISFYDSNKFIRYTDSNGVYTTGQYC